MTETPDTPAKFHPGHVAEVVDASKAGSSKRYRNAAEDPIELAYRKCQLIRGIARDAKGNDLYSAQDRYTAAVTFRRVWEACAASGRDSTNMDRISGNGAEPLTIAKADAIRRLSQIYVALNRQDREIIQYVCGEGWWPSEAVAKVCGLNYKHATLPRLCEALDNLVDVLGKMKRLADFEKTA